MATGVSDLHDQADDEGNDSGVEDVDVRSETTTLVSAIRDYRFENNRRYHGYKDGEYWAPNDEKANDALDITHHLFLITFGDKLLLAPIGPNPTKVLDVGTGTGIWAIDFADTNPKCEVIGTDLSPTQPTWVPPNCKFEIDDVNEDWTFAPNSFDFIHVRGMFGSVGDWSKFYQECLKALKPGAYLEQAEMSVIFRSHDNTVNDTTIIGQSGAIFIEAGRKIGKSFTIVDEMKGLIAAAGFEDVQERVFQWPVGPWCRDKKLKEIGRWNRLHLIESLEGYTIALLTRVMGWQYTEVQAWLGLMLSALKDSKTYHTYHEMKVVYARKPLS